VSAPRIALALGGGGARGLAHIPLLEAFDELGVRPHRLAGSSMGGLVAAAYAAGMPARDIHERFGRMLVQKGDSWRDIFGRSDLRKWFDIVELNIGRGGLIRGDSLREFLAAGHIEADFADLAIPLKLVAADYWTWEEVVIDRGELPLAVQATMAVPGVFLPVERNGRVLIDGSTVDPVPYDLWNDDADVRIAIDVAGGRPTRKHKQPTIFQSVFNTVQIMQRAIINAKVADDPPDILIRPDIGGVRMFAFHKIDEVYAAAETAKDELKRELARVLEGKAAE